MARGSNRKKTGGHGGARQPTNPAAVSAPGSGARTDGGAGSKRQPLRLAPGQGYGERQAMENLQRANPMAVAGGAGPPGPAGAGAPQAGAPPVNPDGLFGPSRRPLESPLAGLPERGTEPLDAQSVIRVLYRKRPSPWLAKLLAGD